MRIYFLAYINAIIDKASRALGNAELRSFGTHVFPLGRTLFARREFRVRMFRAKNQVADR